MKRRLFVHNKFRIFIINLFAFLLISCGGGKNQNFEKYTSAVNTKSGFPPVVFKEVTKDAGIITETTWKYGGPSIADLDGDGRYELMLSNHHEVPAQLFWSVEPSSYEQHGIPLLSGDVHGIAPGDYDGDKDLDLLISVGGGNGTTPQPPRLLRNDNGSFVDVTEQSGLAGKGARGRAVRWIDLDGDGDLDIIQINAPVTIGENIPRNLMFQNVGEGHFEYVPNEDFEQIDAERVLITDFNGDHIPDLVCFSPLSIWQGTGELNFIEVSDTILPAALQNAPSVMAVEDIDVDNDGDLDLYLARGKTYYELANNSVTLDHQTGQLDLRDEGNQSHDGLSFLAEGAIKLHDFFRWYRGVEFEPQVFLGANRKAIPAPVAPVLINQKEAIGFPKETTEDGWYLGYLGSDKWRLEWRLNGDIAWGIRASITGVKTFETDWIPEPSGVADVLLINSQGKFTDAGESLPQESLENNWGITSGDFNNDGWNDLFLYRFGGLNKRIPDVLLMNQVGAGFLASTDHNATPTDGFIAHGDMGAAFDCNLDGRVDLLSGDDDQGTWHLYSNDVANTGNYLLVNVGYSELGLDPHGAEVWLKAGELSLYQRVGSAGATHSQSLLNTVHFGIASNTKVDSVSVRWRDGSYKEMKGITVNQRVSF